MGFIDSEYKERLKQRIEQRYQQGQLAPVHRLGGGRDMTPEEIIDAIRQDTPDAEGILIREKKLMDELEKMRKR